MSASFNTAVPLIIIGLVLLVIAVWLIMRLGKTTTIVGDGSVKKDVLDEGAAPAQRNQALIDAAPAAVANNFGTTSAVANTAPVAAAPATADAEAGPAITPTRAPVSETAPAPEPTPEPAPASAPTPSATVKSDDLRRIKGVGPKLVTLLAQEGVTHFAQIAAWSDSDVAKIDAKLGRFKGRIERDQWVEQAKLLISDDKDAYAAKFGNNG
ncbi:MAG: hypothetical protein AAF291_07795 [Pseudomonadota bacterium]